MRMKVTKSIEYTFYIEVDPEDYKNFQEDEDYGHLDKYVDVKDPAYYFDHEVIDINAHMTPYT